MLFYLSKCGVAVILRYICGSSFAYVTLHMCGSAKALLTLHMCVAAETLALIMICSHYIASSSNETLVIRSQTHTLDSSHMHMIPSIQSNKH